MRKRTSKLTLHRETLRALEPASLQRAGGGDECPICPDQTDVPTEGCGGGSIWSGPFVCPYPSFACASTVITICPTCG